MAEGDGLADPQSRLQQEVDQQQVPLGISMRTLGDAADGREVTAALLT
jgi:hypothetical protein